MTPFPLGFDPPGKRRYTSTPQTRSAELLFDVLAEHQVRGFARYQPRDVDGKPGLETFCNVHTADVAEAMGVTLPRGKRANELALWLASGGTEHGWEQIDEHTARAMADEGMLALAVWFNPTGGPGHIAPLQPSLGAEGLWLSNVGTFNTIRCSLARAFGSRAVDLFVHP